jgi:hypothetical protein
VPVQVEVAMTIWVLPLLMVPCKTTVYPLARYVKVTAPAEDTAATPVVTPSPAVNVPDASTVN